MYAAWGRLKEHDKAAFVDKVAFYSRELCEAWKEVMKADKEPELHGTGTPWRKPKWTEEAYSLGQDFLLCDDPQKARAISVLAQMSFIRGTVCRPGSVSKDYTDQDTKWGDVNVMSVSDVVWSPGGMDIEWPNGEVEKGALRAEVRLNRVKLKYYENYQYDMSLTPDQREEARRGSTLMLVYQFARGRSCRWRR